MVYLVVIIFCQLLYARAVRFHFLGANMTPADWCLYCTELGAGVQCCSDERVFYGFFGVCRRCDGFALAIQNASPIHSFHASTCVLRGADNGRCACAASILAWKSSRHRLLLPWRFFYSFKLLSFWHVCWAAFTCPLL